MSIPTDAPSPLGVYRVLSPNAGLRVSPLQLGGMIVRNQQEESDMSAMDKEMTIKSLDAFYKLGGNFIDTANLP